MRDGTPTKDAELVVDGRELRLRLDSIRRFIRPGEPADALLTFDGSQLRIALPGVAVRVGAQGRWTGAARIDVLNVLRIARLPPEIEQVEVHISGQMVTVSLEDGILEFPCEWTLASHSTRNDATSGEFPMSGAAPAELSSSREALERRIKGAARMLALYGVTESELRDLVGKKTGSDGCSHPVAVGPADDTDLRECVLGLTRLRDRFGILDQHLATLLEEGQSEEGIDAYIGYLQVIGYLGPAERRLGRRLRLCLELRRAGEAWPSVIERARKAYP